MCVVSLTFAQHTMSAEAQYIFMNVSSSNTESGRSIPNVNSNRPKHNRIAEFSLLRDLKESMSSTCPRSRYSASLATQSM